MEDSSSDTDKQRYLSSMFDDFCLSVEWVEPRLQLTPHLWDLQNSTATDLVPGKVVYFVLFCVFTIHFLCVSTLFFAKLNRHRSSARYNCTFFILLCVFILHFLCGFPSFFVKLILLGTKKKPYILRV